MWTCTGFFWLYFGEIKTHRVLSFAQWNAYCLFGNAINLEALNTFLYTWRFIEALENSYQGNIKKACKLFRVVSVFLVPTVYLLLYIALQIDDAKHYNYFLHN